LNGLLNNFYYKNYYFHVIVRLDYQI